MLRAHLPSPWNDRVVGGFRKGAMEANVSVGIGPGSAILGSTATHDIALAKLSLGRVVSNTRAEGRWYRGNWELLGEMFGGGQFEPNAAYLVGLTGVLRYNFVTSTRLVPFFDLGAGVSATDIGRPDLGSTFEFNTQIGGGLRWFFNAHAAITAQYRLLHLSNAGTAHPNGGVNTSMFYVGVSWIF